MWKVRRNGSDILLGSSEASDSEDVHAEKDPKPERRKTPSLFDRLQLPISEQEMKAEQWKVNAGIWRPRSETPGFLRKN
jgi:hypothetical protein